MGPVKLDAHIELGAGSAAKHQAFPHRQPDLRGGQGEVINLVSCSGKGWEDTAVSGATIVLWRLHTLSTFSIVSPFKDEIYVNMTDLPTTATMYRGDLNVSLPTRVWQNTTPA